jgi:hypothetical protein
VNHPVSKREPAFSLILGTTRDAAELMAECQKCGAMTMLPIEVAWQLGVVHCCECATRMSVTRAVFEQLRAQAEGASEAIRRLIG